MPPDDIPSNGAESLRPQPSKQGEIGYIEAVEPPTDILHTLNLYDLPTSHSFDRNSSPISPDALIFPPAQSEVITYPSSDQSSTASITKPNEMLDFFKPQGQSALGGLRLCTLAIFVVQLFLLGGTITAWVFASKLLALTAEKNNQTSFGYPSTIAVHIIFIVIILIQIVFLERLLSRLRDERYSYVHHGEIPLQRSTPRSSVTSAFAPWNRPPLPTYAATLAQSGETTGDVEDHIIAAPPPPAYGNTRGSTLLLRGLSRDSLSRESGTGRLLSYVSRDEQRDQVQNVECVWRLGETMDRLEPPSPAYFAR